MASRGCEIHRPQHLHRIMVANSIKKGKLATAGNFPWSVGLTFLKRDVCFESHDKNGVQTIEGQDGRESLSDISPDEVVSVVSQD